MSQIAHTPEPEEGLPNYLSRLTQVPLLTAQQEEDLMFRVRNGDGRARQRLIEANMRLVINIAKSYRSKAIPLEDLIQEGAIGLMQAAERFDPSRGFRFSTYATHWVRQAIGRAIDNKSKAIRLPAHISQAIRRIDREKTRLSLEIGREPTFDEIARACDMTVARMEQILQAGQEMISLDSNVGEGTTTLGGMLRDDRCPDPEDKLISEEVRQELRRIFLELSDRERTVMEHRFFGSNDDDSTGHEELAKEMNVTRERVRQIETQAIKKLRLLASQRRLREVLVEANELGS